jgi:hypothetical protein
MFDSNSCFVINEGLSEIIGPFPVPPPRDKRERNDDAGQKRSGHWYCCPLQTTAYINYPDGKQVNDRDHSRSESAIGISADGSEEDQASFPDRRESASG